LPLRARAHAQDMLASAIRTLAARRTTSRSTTLHFPVQTRKFVKSYIEFYLDNAHLRRICEFREASAAALCVLWTRRCCRELQSCKAQRNTHFLCPAVPSVLAKYTRDLPGFRVVQKCDARARACTLATCTSIDNDLCEAAARDIPEAIRRAWWHRVRHISATPNIMLLHACGYRAENPTCAFPLKGRFAAGIVLGAQRSGHRFAANWPFARCQLS